ncbi:hypothetical protein B0H11DRAFT_1959659 [Mycena galericulata]|nr:hypothetical protein B0H11DRAFT_1959659 [Mycena galericulata]
MLSILFPLFSAARLPLVRAQDPQPPMANISDPVGVVQCLPYTFTWTGGVPSYDVSVYSETGTSLFSATVNSTNVTWIPVNGVGATADVPVSFNVIIQDHSLYSESMSSYENITAGSIAVDSSGYCRFNLPELLHDLIYLLVDARMRVLYPLAGPFQPLQHLCSPLQFLPLAAALSRSFQQRLKAASKRASLFFSLILLLSVRQFLDRLRLHLGPAVGFQRNIVGA